LSNLLFILHTKFYLIRFIHIFFRIIPRFTAPKTIFFGRRHVSDHLPAGSIHQGFSVFRVIQNPLYIHKQFSEPIFKPTPRNAACGFNNIVDKKINFIPFCTYLRGKKRRAFLSKKRPAKNAGTEE
jgi:hypothetical protein